MRVANHLHASEGDRHLAHRLPSWIRRTAWHRLFFCGSDDFEVHAPLTEAVGDALAFGMRHQTPESRPAWNQPL
eukprot:9473945-Pyramimonas_sp.AAC.1